MHCNAFDTAVTAACTMTPLRRRPSVFPGDTGVAAAGGLPARQTGDSPGACGPAPVAWPPAPLAWTSPSLTLEVDPEPLVEGGQGSVHRGRHACGAEWAFVVKRPHAFLPASALNREAEVLAALPPHRHILPAPVRVIHRAGAATAELQGLAFPLYARGDLVSLCDHNARPFSVAEVRVLAAQLLAALTHAHAHGVFHLDIKPDNVLVDEDGAAVLADWGSAMRVGPAGRLPPGPLGVTTPWYRAPELWVVPRPGAPDPDLDLAAVDVYALGRTLTALLLRTMPFGDPVAVARAVADGCKPLAEFLGSMLAPVPGERWSAARLAGHAFLTATAP
jgi:hypothetical protein